MNTVSAAFAKLAGVLKSVETLLETSRKAHSRPTTSFSPDDVADYFYITDKQIHLLRKELADLYSDFSSLEISPKTKMTEQADHPYYFSRNQLESLSRYINQVFELRSNSELATPVTDLPSKVFISHGRTNDWTEVQDFIERDMDIPTLELAQEPNRGRSVLQKLDEESSHCNYAVIVMTGEDSDAEGNLKARENVMHEIGYFQGKFGLSAVCLLHEEGTNIPSNIQGLVYIPFPNGYVSATFGALMRELKAFFE